MKKRSTIYFSLISFILGALISSLSVYFFVHIREIEEIEKNNKDTIETLNKKIEDLKSINQRLELMQVEKRKKLNGLIGELKSKDYSLLTKNILLSKEIDNNPVYSKLMLEQKQIEPLPEDDIDIKKLKKEFDKNIKSILNVSAFILKEKVDKLNLRIMEKNRILSSTNNKLDETNSTLDNTNLKLKSLNTTLEKKNSELNKSLSSIKDFKNKLELQNKKLNKSLNEIKKYKVQLEHRKKQIVSLKKIEKELNKVKSNLETKLENGKLKVSFKGDILFESGSHKLKKEGKKLIDSVYPILKANIKDNNIFIAGHTDNVKIKTNTKRKYESNWDLSTYRAIEVVKYLTKKGMSPNNITAAGFGKFRPIANNSTKSGRQKNRRVELFLTPKIINRKNQ